MRKKSFNKRHGLFSILIATAFIAASIFSITACKKETSTSPGQTAINSENDQKVIEQIRAFKEKMEYYRDNPQLKGGGETYSAEEASIELESLLNYDFCYTNVECNLKTYSVSQIIMPLDDLKRINDPALMQVYYDRVIDTIQAQMLRINYTNMKLLLVDLELDGYDSNGDATINIGSLVGNENPVILHNYVEWYYGEHQGLCDSPEYVPEDAASQLQKRVIDNVKPYDPTPNCWWTYRNVEDIIFNPLDYSLTTTYDNYLDYRIYYATQAVIPYGPDEKCLTPYEMNFYEDQYTSLVEEKELEKSKDYEDLVISGTSHATGSIVKHDIQLFVGNRIKVCNFTKNDILAVD